MPDSTKSPRRFPPPWTVKETSRPCVADAFPGNRSPVRKSEVDVHVVGSSAMGHEFVDEFLCGDF
jgi:hypothetical protein